MSNDKPRQPAHLATFTREEMAYLLLAQTIETDQKPPKQWRSTISDEASRDAWERVGAQASSHVWLVERAKAILSLSSVDNKLPQQAIMGYERPRRLLTLLAFVLGALAYLLGVFSDRFTSTGALINLLSVPLLGVIAWNCLVYIGIIVRFLARAFGKPLALPIQYNLMVALDYVTQMKLPWRGYQQTFWVNWFRLQWQSYQTQISAFLHVAAALFALGLITSMGMRGVGTAYTVGWESTWFAHQPDIVSHLLALFYGLTPDLIPGSAPLPDVTQTATLEFSSTATAPNAAPWLLRIMENLAFVVIVPRLLLAFLDTQQAKRLRSRFALSLSEPYFKALLAQKPQPHETTYLVDASLFDAEGRWPSQPHSLSPVTSAIQKISFWDTEDAQARATFNAASLPIMVFNANHTPEEDVHGVWLDRLAQKRGHEAVAMVDFSFFDQKNADPSRHQDRWTLWQNTIEAHHVTAAVTPNHSTSQSKSDMI